MKRSLLLSFLLLWLGPYLLVAQTDDELLIEAAQTGNLERAKELLIRGADVNAKTRYGATPLFFACDKGNVPLTKLLIEKGADVNVEDTFYGATPVTWVLFSAEESEPHREILGLLLAEKPEAAAAALPFAAEQGDLELAEVIVASGKADTKALFGAMEMAKGAGHDEVAIYLKKQLPEGALDQKLQVPAETLRTYVGDYESTETGSLFKVYLDGETLMTQGPGDQPPFTLDAETNKRFVLREAPELSVEFRGQEGRIEQLVVLRESGDIVLNRKHAADETPTKEVEAAPVAETLADVPAAQRLAAQPWPAFRGADNAGIGDGQGAPFEWDAASNKNIVWKTPIPGLANSSPIIWGDRIFVTSASTEEGDDSLRIGLYGDVDPVEDTAEHTWAVYALDSASGEILWRRVAAVGVPKVKRHLKSTHANPTPVTDGKHVVASFGSEGVYAYDFEGKLLWKKDFGVLQSGWFYDPTYEWGFASSPILHNGHVILQIDIYEGSHVTALDVTHGKEVWKTGRDEIPTWGTPVVLPAGDAGPAEIITNGTTVRGYDAATGEELWTLAPNSEITVASPIVGNDLAYITGGYPPARPIYAVRRGSRGDLSLTEGETSSESIAWSHERGGAYMPTPLLYRDILYIFHGNGRLAAHDPATGEEIYKARVGSGNSFSGSPVAADGRLFFTSEQGETFVVRAGKVFQELGTNNLDEIVMSTPAISDGLIVIRGKSHVYGIGEAPGRTR